MALRRDCVIVNHPIGEDIADGFKLYFDVSRRWGFVRRDGSARRWRARCR